MSLLRFALVVVLAAAGAAACKGGASKAPPSSADDATTSRPAIEKVADEGPVKATVRVSPDHPRLGDPITLAVRVEAAAGVDIEMPTFGEALGRFSVIEFKPRQSTSPDGGTIHEQSYKLQAPMSGRQRIPPLRIEYVDRRASQPAGPTAVQGQDAGVAAVAPSAEPQELLTEEIPLVIETVLAATDVAPEMAPALGKLDPPAARSDWRALWPPLAIALALLLAGIAFWLWRRGSSRRIQISAYEAARNRLAALARDGSPTPELLDAWYVELSAIVRRYLEDRFNLRAPELTTEEFLREARRTAELTEAHRSLLTQFLEDCDRVKFAGYRPDNAESQAAFERAETFIEQTRLVDERAQPSRAASPTAPPEPPNPPHPPVDAAASRPSP